MENHIYLAKTTSSLETLRELKNSRYSAVRRVVAKNHYTPSSILNELAYDPVENVSFIALQNPKCSVERKNYIPSNNPCVSCEKDELTMVCIDCKTLSNFYLAIKN